MFIVLWPVKQTPLQTFDSKTNITISIIAVLLESKGIINSCTYSNPSVLKTYYTAMLNDCRQINIFFVFFSANKLYMSEIIISMLSLIQNHICNIVQSANCVHSVTQIILHAFIVLKKVKLIKSDQIKSEYHKAISVVFNKYRRPEHFHKYIV